MVFLKVAEWRVLEVRNSIYKSVSFNEINNWEKTQLLCIVRKQTQKTAGISLSRIIHTNPVDV